MECNHFFRFKGMAPTPGNRALGTQRKGIYQCRKCGATKQR